MKLIPLRRVQATAAEFSDEALLAACALGDSAATGALIDRFHQPVYRFVSRLLGSDGHDRDDLVQATFAEIATCAARYRRKSSVKVWIFGIAANLVRNHLRSAVRRRRMESTLAVLPVRSAQRPDREAEGRELMAQLAQAIDALPAPLREVFVLCDLEELPCREAALALGVREGTIWRRLHDARWALRTALERAT
jgi:RNA polymerase sigma-70 factor (ECF subfamily)